MAPTYPVPAVPAHVQTAARTALATLDWPTLAQSAYSAYRKEAQRLDEEGLTGHTQIWAELDAGTQACWLAVAKQQWAEFMAIRNLAQAGYGLMAQEAAAGFTAGPPQGETRPPRGAGSDTQCATVGAI